MPLIIGFAAFWGICYMLSASHLTSTQIFLAIITLILIYCATAGEGRPQHQGDQSKDITQRCRL